MFSKPKTDAELAEPVALPVQSPKSDVRPLTTKPEFMEREPSSKPSDRPTLAQSMKSTLATLHKVEILFVDPPEERLKSLGQVEVAAGVTSKIRRGQLMFALPRDESGFLDTRVFPTDQIAKCRNLEALRNLIVTEWGGVEL